MPKKHHKVALCHYQTKSWEKPKKAPKPDPDPDSTPNPPEPEEDSAQMKKLNFALAYGMENVWGDWKMFPKTETMRDRAMKLLAEKVKAPRVDLMVEFAEKEITRIKEKQQVILDLKNRQISEVRGFLNDQLQRNEEMESEIERLKAELAELRAYKHRAFISAVTVEKGEGRLFREV